LTESIGTPALWIGFHVVVVVALFIDLFVLHKDDHAVSRREALFWSCVWISLSLCFAAGLWFVHGADIGLQFLAGYVVEESLSVDNLFVFLLIFGYFKVPAEVQHRVLFWGIFGAIVLRGTMIGLGVALIARFEWLLLFFAVILIWSSVKLLLIGDDDEEDLSNNKTVAFARWLVKATDQYDGSKFITVVDGVKRLTPLALVLVVVELSDVVFAVDSIPAVFGVAEDPFIIYSSNICAILGLRSLYFLLAAALSGMRFLGPCLGLVLGFVGVKMILGYFGVHLHVAVALGVVGGLLATGVVLSLLFPHAPKAEEGPGDDDRAK
jgi:tellurite resistance protein TerC